MRKIFEDMFYQDLESIEQQNEKFNSKSYSNTNKELEKHDKFWKSLNNTQKKEFIEHESVVAKENALFQKEIYIYALKKGIALVFSSCFNMDD